MIETIFYLGISALTIIVVVLTVVYIMRLSPSKGNPKKNSEGGQVIKKSNHKEKVESIPVLEDLSRGDIPKQIIPSSDKPTKLEPAVVEVLPEAKEIVQAVSLEKTEPQPKTESITYINRKVDGQKTPEPVITLPANLKQAVVFKDESQNLEALPIVAPVNVAVNEPSSSGNKATSLSPGATRPLVESVDTVLIPDITEIKRESEPSVGNKRGNEIKELNTMPPAAPISSGKNNKEVSQSKSLGMGDLADLFSKAGSENTESDKLAADLNYVDVNDLLQEGNLVLEKLKKISH